MKNAIVLVDSENFFHKVDQILHSTNIKSVDKASIKLDQLISEVFQPYTDIKISQINFYAAKLSIHPKTVQKSKQLISQQRKLKTTFENKGVKFITSGHVRGFEQFDSNGQTKVTFKEKGVDVRIAVDMVTIACDKAADTIILCSSDSDLQPAVKEAKSRGINIIYLGFSIDPNKGLTITTDQTILFRNPEIVKALTP